MGRMSRNEAARLPQERIKARRPRERRFRGWRGWTLRVAMLVVAPLLFFGLLEAGLRCGGYGYPTSFFLGPATDGSFATNPRFGWRFFPRPLARAPQPCVLVPKPAGTVRIFVLGGSAAMGTPDPAYSFGRILGAMLREQYPGTRFEVVGAAMTAINSHVCLQIARDCAAHQPDLFVIYMGNNEVVGPFGPGTVFGQWSPKLGLIRSSLWVKSTRTGQLLADAASHFRGKEEGSWRGMQMFLNNEVAGDAPRLAAVYDNYRHNLADICTEARSAGVPVVLSTLAVNTRDCPPFASLHRADLTPEQKAKWESCYAEGSRLEAAGRFAEALDRYEAAAQVDSRFAELHYRTARCLAKTDRAADANRRFAQACDLDALRFRADSHINKIVREVAAAQEAAGVRLADAEGAFDAAGQDGKDVRAAAPLFYEHVHMTFAGNYLLAETVLEQTRRALPQLNKVEPRPLPSQERCAQLLALTPWDEYQMAADMAQMTAKPPFTRQLDHKERQAAARQRAAELRLRASTPETNEAAWKTYEAAIAQTPDDWSLHLRFGRLAMHCGRTGAAVEHLQAAAVLAPGDGLTRRQLASALDADGQAGKAIACLRTVLEIQPDDELAHYNLANILARVGKTTEAVASYRRAIVIWSDYAEAHYNLGNTLARRGDVDEAVSHLRKAAELEPEAVEVCNNLAAILAGSGRVDEAIVYFEKSLKLAPDDAGIRENLLTARREQENIQRVMARRHELVEARPGDLVLMCNTAWLLATAPNTSIRNGAEAVKLAEAAVALCEGGQPEALDALGAAYAETGRFGEAVTTARKAMTLAAKQGNQPLEDGIRARMRLYEAGAPFRQPPTAFHKALAIPGERP